MRPLRGIATRFGAVHTLGPLLALAALLAANILFTPGFGAVDVIGGRLVGAPVDILQNGAPVMLLAIGMTLVIALGGIDLSVGSVMAIAGTAAAVLMTAHGWGAAPASLAALAAGAAAGAFNGLLVAFVRLQPIVATLVLLVAGRGIAQWLASDQKIRLNPADAPAFEAIANGVLLGVPTPVYIVAAVALAVAAALRWTALGITVEAVGNNPRAAFLCGLPVRGVNVAAFAFSGLCAGVAGLIATADIREADAMSMGLYLELDAILAVVIGGTSLTGGRPRLFGSLVGALVMQTLTVTLQMHNVIAEHTLMVKAVAAIAVCTLQTPFAGAAARAIWRRKGGWTR